MMLRLAAFLLPFALGLGAAQAGTLPETPPDFETAVDHLSRIYVHHTETFTCSCLYQPSPRSASGVIAHEQGCSYAPRENAALGARIRWTHVMPPFEMTRTPSCFLGDGACLARREPDPAHPHLAEMLADMNNIVPEIAEIAEDRAAAPLVTRVLQKLPRPYGGCEAELEPGVGMRPEPSRRGDVARIYLYMHDVWGVPLDPDDLVRLRRWHEEDPPDAWERRKNEAVARLQGRGNPWIEQHREQGTAR